MDEVSLVIPIITIVVLLLVYVALALFYDKFRHVHQRVRDFVMRNRRPYLDKLMHLTHVVNGAVSMSVLTAFVALWLGIYGKVWKEAFVMTSSMLLVTAIIHGTKALHKSNRPPQNPVLAEILMKTYSYPSGHSAASMTFALIVPSFLAMHIGLGFVIPIAIILMINALATAYGRLYLDMHWLADILGGWSMAIIVMLATQIFMKMT